mgnify:CR=1 FL=1
MIIELDGYIIEGTKRIGRYSKFDLYRLHERKEGKRKGEIVKKVVWYSANIKQCLQAITQSRLSTVDELSADEFLKKYDEVSVKIKEDINKVVKAFDDLVESNKQLK